MKYIVGTMVGVAQLVEPWIVIPVVVGSNPITHPNFACNCAHASRASRSDTKQKPLGINTSEDKSGTIITRAFLLFAQILGH